MYQILDIRACDCYALKVCGDYFHMEAPAHHPAGLAHLYTHCQPRSGAVAAYLVQAGCIAGSDNALFFSR
jgi:hypothetical protein